MNKKEETTRRFNKKVDGARVMELYAQMPTADVARETGRTVKQIYNFVHRENPTPGGLKEAAVRSSVNRENGRKGGRPRKDRGK